MRLHHGAYLHHVGEDAHHLVAGIVKSLATKQEFDYVFAIYLLVVFEKDVEGHLRLDHVLCQNDDGGLGCLVQVSEGLLLVLHLLLLK